MNRLLKHQNTNYSSDTADNIRTQERIDIPDLRLRLKGRMILPDDADYDEARTIFYNGFDRRPELIVRVADATDVSRVVLLARQTGLELAIRSGGHSIAGHSLTDGGIVLDLRDMRQLIIDPENRTAWAQTGLTVGEYTNAAGKYGLATGFGDSGLVGIGGITLGGGIGFLTRKYGLTIDDLLAAEIVTADGQILNVDSETHPDLFWAIRGGGGNFGVATWFKFRLHKVDEVVGGMLVLPATPELLRDFVAEAEAASEDLSTIVNVMAALPMPIIPSEYHGQLIIMAMMVHAGEVDDGQRAIKPFRALATPIVDTVRPINYPEIYPPDDDYRPLIVDHTFFMDEFNATKAEVIFGYLQNSTTQSAVAHIRILGGAMARVPVESTAFAHRQRRILMNAAAIYEHPDEAAGHEAWVTDFATALRQGDVGGYVNFMGEDGTERIREAYPGMTWERLRAIKSRYDPTNLFRLNHNIPPRKEQYNDG